MEHPRKARYDYFLIWGNGLPYKTEIIRMIRSDPFLRITRIMDHKPKSTAMLVRAIYSYDYAPLQHLKSKTRYLLKTDPDVVFVFVLNQDAQETYRGEGAFRHVECERIQRIKGQIRDEFNPRKDGKRTEEHVVHASDNEAQVHQVLRYLGFPQGLGFLARRPNPVLSVPHYCPAFREFTIRCVDSKNLYCNILRGERESFRLEVVRIDETPHFAGLTGSLALYEEYLSTFLGGPLTGDYSPENLLALFKNLVYLEPPFCASYILVKRLREDDFLILDGVHRASVLICRAVPSFPVAVIE
jgi:hypothetical protein